MFCIRLHHIYFILFVSVSCSYHNFVFLLEPLLYEFVMVLGVSHQLELNHCYSLTGAYIALKQKMTRRGKSRAKSSPTKPRRVNKLTLQKQTTLKAFRTILSDCEFTETQGVLQNLLSSKETPKGEKENTHATPENSLPSDSGQQSAGMADVFSSPPSMQTSYRLNPILPAGLCIARWTAKYADVIRLRQVKKKV